MGFCHVKVSKNFMSFLAYRYGVIVFSFRIEFTHFLLLFSILSGFSFGFMKQIRFRNTHKRNELLEVKHFVTAPCLPDQETTGLQEVPSLLPFLSQHLPSLYCSHLSIRHFLEFLYGFITQVGIPGCHSFVLPIFLYLI